MPALALAQSMLTSNASSLRDGWYLNSAEQQLTAQCMKRLGFVYLIPHTGPVPGLNTITEFALGRGYPATYGVTPESLIAAPPSDPEADKPGYQLALDGPAGSLGKLNLPGGASVGYETGGCQGSARSQLFGSVGAYVLSSYLPQIEKILFEKFLGRDQAYLPALHTWQACMRAEKFSVANPGDAVGSLLQIADKTSAADLMRRQTALAAADASCDRPSHLRQRTNQALGRFVGSLSRQTLTQLNDIAHSRATADQVARRVIPGELCKPWEIKSGPPSPTAGRSGCAGGEEARTPSSGTGTSPTRSAPAGRNPACRSR
jgi:hypothetical protein